MKKNDKINIFIFPSQNKNNKYIELFISSIVSSGKNIEVVFTKNDFLPNIFLKLFSIEILKAKNIIHIHWPTVFYGSRFLSKSIILLFVNFIFLFLLKTIFRFKVVSTVHNFYAHDYKHPKIDKFGSWAVYHLSNTIIVQQISTLEKYREKFPNKEILYIPHGNYVNTYGQKISRDYDFKKSLGFKNEDVVIMSFGAIAPYKMNENIINIFANAIKSQSVATKLLIVGKGNHDYVNSLRGVVNHNSNIVIKNTFVVDEDVSKYFSIADFSVFYYDQSEMTSGAMILSLSYGVPVIVRNIPASEIINDKNGFVFQDELELEEILTKLCKSPKKFDPHDIINSVKANSWFSGAKTLISIYEKI